MHATEDAEKVKKATYNLLPADQIEKVMLKKRSLEGHYRNPIILHKTRIKDKEVIKAFIKKLSTNLSESDKETILKEPNLFIEKGSLYLRLNKQAAFENEFELCKSDAIYIRIRFRKKDARSTIEVCRELGLVP